MNLVLQTVVTPKQRQQGGALLVAMILIFMLSIMGISSMRGSTLERRMASNSVQAATTFQGAESGSEVMLNDKDNLADAITIANVEAVMVGEMALSPKLNKIIDMKQAIGMESEAEVQFTGFGPAYGYSAGNASSNFMAYRFEVKADAKIKAVSSNASVIQGAYRIAPGRQL